MNSVTFRAARREDVPAIVRLLADDVLGAGRERAVDPLPDSYWRAWEAIAARAGCTLLLAIDDRDVVVGCLQLDLLPGLSQQGMWRGQVEGVRVAAGQRGRGLGAAMLRHAISLARTAGCGSVQLTSNAARTDARRFYERLGFVASHVGMKLDLK